MDTHLGPDTSGQSLRPSGRVDEQAAAIAAERVRSGAAEEKEDEAAALESLGISFSGQDISERFEHEPATLAAFEAGYGERSYTGWGRKGIPHQR
jgi:hypothetical protein